MARPGRTINLVRNVDVATGGMITKLVRRYRPRGPHTVILRVPPPPPLPRCRPGQISPAIAGEIRPDRPRGRGRGEGGGPTLKIIVFGPLPQEHVRGVHGGGGAVTKTAWTRPSYLSV